jgi:hypothetical protein
MTCRALAATSVLVAAWVLSGGAIARAGDTTEFLRGDFNEDRKVSIADGHAICNFLFRGGQPSACMNTMDADDDGHGDLNDAIHVLRYSVHETTVAPPSAPFPGVGLDPTANPDDFLSCESYGAGQPLNDPAASISVSAVAAGGDNGEATITVTISHSAVISGYSGRILLDTSVIGGVTGEPTDLSGTFQAGFMDAALDNGRLDFGYLSTLTRGEDHWLQPAEGQAALEIPVCLKDGARAGEYALTLTLGEMVDSSTARSIDPTLVSGTLTVLEDLADGAGCSAAGCTSAPPPPADPLPPINARYELTDAISRPGAEVTVPFAIYADAEVQGYAFSCDFDEDVLQATEIEPVVDVEASLGFKRLELNNRNATAGSGGVDEGFLVGAMVFSFRDNCHNLPAGRSNEVLRFHFSVNEATTQDSTQVRFLDGGKGSGQPVRNGLTAFGTLVVPELASSFVFVDAVIGVQPDITTFVRGDSNGDAKVELADAIHTLGFLFLGTDTPACYDAADFNDDGKIGLVDPVATLTFLFASGKSPEQPFPAAGEDPTADGMGCLIGP